MLYSRLVRVVIAGLSLAFCLSGPASGQDGKKGQWNQKDDGQRNQRGDGQQNQNDDDGKRVGVAELRAGAAPGLKFAVPAAVGPAAVLQFNAPHRVGVLQAEQRKAAAGENGQNDDGPRNQKDDGQRNQRGKKR